MVEALSLKANVIDVENSMEKLADVLEDKVSIEELDQLVADLNVPAPQNQDQARGEAPAEDQQELDRRLAQVERGLVEVRNESSTQMGFFVSKGDFSRLQAQISNYVSTSDIRNMLEDYYSKEEVARVIDSKSSSDDLKAEISVVETNINRQFQMLKREIGSLASEDELKTIRDSLERIQYQKGVNFQSETGAFSEMVHLSGAIEAVSLKVDQFEEGLPPLYSQIEDQKKQIQELQVVLDKTCQDLDSFGQDLDTQKQASSSMEAKLEEQVLIRVQEQITGGFSNQNKKINDLKKSIQEFKLMFSSRLEEMTTNFHNTLFQEQEASGRDTIQDQTSAQGSLSHLKLSVEKIELSLKKQSRLWETAKDDILEELLTNLDSRIDKIDPLKYLNKFQNKLRVVKAQVRDLAEEVEELKEGSPSGKIIQKNKSKKLEKNATKKAINHLDGNKTQNEAEKSTSQKPKFSTRIDILEEKLDQLQKLSEDLYTKFFTQLERKLTNLDLSLKEKADKSNIAVILDSKASKP